VCYDLIRRRNPIWSCGKCWALFHVSCIDKWSKSSAQEKGYEPGKFGVSRWRCPGCQEKYEGTPEPSCFCGKERQFEWNPYVLPHSCGALCQRHRVGSSCPHRCSLYEYASRLSTIQLPLTLTLLASFRICHPGPCPPCSSLGNSIQCYCGSSTYRLRCGEEVEGMSCNELCDKLLSCGRHRCQQICHPGSSRECTLEKCVGLWVRVC